MDDPAYRFTVVYKDGREMSQEDENGCVVRDHCHVEDWDNVEIYSLRNRPGDHVISVNFTNGDFSINGTKLKMMCSDLDLLRGQHEQATFKPLFGRTHFQGEMGHAIFYKLGWDAFIGNKTIRRILYVSENGEVFFEA